MDRRKFVANLSLAAVALGNFSLAYSSSKVENNLLKPKRLREGSKIGVIAPATNVSDPDDLRKAIEAAEYFGLVPVLGKSLTAGTGFRTKGRAARVDDIHEFFKDPSIDGIFCIRGGYGSADLLDLIDYKLIAANPKVFVGYSDITAMHLAIQKHSGLITFHGPVLLSGFTNYTAESFRKTVFQAEPIGLLKNPTQKSGIRDAYPVRTIKSGTAKGKLTGGNLSLICSLMGTPYEIDTHGKILFIEDVGEEPFRIDRMLTQLRLAGKLSQAAGIIVGSCNDCVIKSAPPVFDAALGDVLDRHLSELPIPSFYGLMIGHTSDQLTLPMSMNAEINADLGTVLINDSAVV